jgi:hypothetical protein
VGNASAGPYSLGNRFVDSASISIVATDSTRGQPPPYTYIQSLNSLHFAHPLDSTDSLRVSFEPHLRGLLHTYTLYPKRSFNPATPAESTLVQPPLALSALQGAENLTIRGYKSVGISLGSLGQMNMQQALDMTVEGSVGATAQLRAHISDEGSSLDGATREISELDRIYVTLTHPRFEITVGDQYHHWERGGLLSLQKKVQGISARLNHPRLGVGAFGALSGGRLAVQTMRGENARQGPYYLRGNGEADIISPMSGTVRVSLDGVTLQEGEEHDFIVDYDMGTITFTPRRLITSEQFIRVEYEYRTFDYVRSIGGTDVHVANADSTMRIQGMLWYEQDNATQPLDVVIGENERQRLRQSGDSSMSMLAVRPVHPQDVAQWDARTPLYRLDSLGHYYHHRFNPALPTDNRGFFRVSFTKVDSGQGDYTQDTVLAHFGPIYTFAGPGRGEWSVPAAIPAPQRQLLGELSVGLQPTPWLSLATVVAGTHLDRNQLSELDDSDNNDGATRSSIRIGQQNPAHHRGAWLSGSHRYIGADFTQEILTAREQNNEWQREHSDTLRTTRQLWDAGGGFSLGPLFNLSSSYAQFIQDNEVQTDRIGAALSWQPHQRLQSSYQGALFRHRQEQQRGRTDALGVSLAGDRSRLALRYVDEVRTAAEQDNRGHCGVQLQAALEPAGIEQSLSYTHHNRGNRTLFFFTDKTDTATTLEWKQSLSLKPHPAWQLQGSSAWHRYRQSGSEQRSALLLSLNSTVDAAAHAFSSSQNYALSMEKASRQIQVPKYIGPSLGTHRYDTLLQQYVPDRGGDYVLLSDQVYDTLGNASVRTSRLSVSWSWHPRATGLIGLLQDLTLQGEWVVEEHLRDEQVGGQSWIPGAITLSRGERFNPALSLSTLHYRQQLLWQPDTLPWQGTLSARPWVQQLHDRRESGVQTELALERTVRLWTLALGAQGLWLHHERPDAAQRFDATDGSARLSQEISLPLGLRLFAQQTLGQSRSSTPQRPWQSSGYFIIRPGIGWKALERGFAEMSYSFAQVGTNPLEDYRLAGGFEAGRSQVVDVLATIAVGEHFNLNATYRAEFSRPPEARRYSPGIHALSLEVKAFL